MRLQDALSLVNEILVANESDEFSITLRKRGQGNILVEVDVACMYETDLRSILAVIAKYQKITYKLDENAVLKIMQVNIKPIFDTHITE